MKRILFIALTIVNTIITITLVVFGGIIRTYADVYLPLGTLLILPLFIGLVYILEFILLTVLTYLYLPPLKYRFMPSVAVCLVLFAAVLFIPYTKAYVVINYKINYDHRQEFVESLEDKIETLQQIDEDTYLVKDLRLSYNGTVRIDSSGVATKVMFSTYLGSSYVIVYSSDKSGVSEGDFSNEFHIGYPLEFKSITEMDDCWTIAVKE